MRRINKNIIVNVYGDNNNISFNGNRSRLSSAIKIVFVAAIVLAVSYCCPELRADIIRLIISSAMNS